METITLSNLQNNSDDGNIAALQNNSDDGNITAAGDGAGTGAGLQGSGSEDTPKNSNNVAGGYEGLINNQNKIIEDLINQNNRLTQQIQGLLRNGASVTPEGEKQRMPQSENNGLPEDYIPLSDLGKNIGKKNEK